MKKGGAVLISLTAAFFCVLLGIFIGRNTVIGINAAPLNSIMSSKDIYMDAMRSGKFDINLSTAQQLQLIPGIGAVLAQNIVDYREENGPFLTVDELIKVDGIGQTLLEEIMEYIYISG